MAKNMRIVTILAITFLLPSVIMAQIYQADETEVTFESKTPIEDIYARNTRVRSFLNSATREIVFNVPIKDFRFKNKLMEEHFNENYLESDKYPNSTFSAKLPESTDLQKDGSHKVTVSGKMNIHGVERNVQETGTIKIKGSIITIESAFQIMLVDYKIEVPQIVFAKIAEKIDVKIRASYAPYKKK